VVSGDYSSFRGTVFGVPILRGFFSQVSNLQKALTWVELKKSLVLSSKADIQNEVDLMWCPYHGKDQGLN
jgi:hypothetical protein